MQPSIRWTEQELEADRQSAIANFRRVRVEEPLEEYLEFFDQYQSVVEELLEATVDLSELHQHVAGVLASKDGRDAVRFLTGPPVSLDDLKVIAEAEAIKSKRALRTDTAMVGRIAQVILSGLDRARFPWVIESREATELERAAAVVASAALMATSKAMTKRRTTSKREQEALVEATLLRANFQKIRTRPMPTLYSAPAPGEFCGEAILGKRKADLILRLWDNRTMPIECKVSNSFTNSIKRLNNDAAVKATSWLSDLGSLQVVPCAVLSGTYKLASLLDAQSRGLMLVWAHNLNPLLEWIEGTRS